jgi:hypothetical protein
VLATLLGHLQARPFSSPPHSCCYFRGKHAPRREQPNRLSRQLSVIALRLTRPGSDGGQPSSNAAQSAAAKCRQYRRTIVRCLD